MNNWISLTQIVASAALVLVTAVYAYETSETKKVEKEKLVNSQMPVKTYLQSPSRSNSFITWGGSNFQRGKIIWKTDEEGENESRKLYPKGKPEPESRGRGPSRVSVSSVMRQRYSWDGRDPNDKEEKDYPVVVQATLPCGAEIRYRFRIVNGKYRITGFDSDY